MTKGALERYKHCAALGMSTRETANTLGVDRTTVCAFAKRYGITYAKERMGRPPGSNAPVGLAIVKALDQPKTTVALAEEVGATIQTIKNHLKYLTQNGFVRFVGSAGRTSLWAKGEGL